MNRAWFAMGFAIGFTLTALGLTACERSGGTAARPGAESSSRTLEPGVGARMAVPAFPSDAPESHALHRETP